VLTRAVEPIYDHGTLRAGFNADFASAAVLRPLAPDALRHQSLGHPKLEPLEAPIITIAMSSTMWVTARWYPFTSSG
jgi:hypothetical protein